MSEGLSDINVDSLFSRPKWWVPTAIFQISIAVFIGGVVVSIGETMKAYEHATEASDMGVLGATLAAALQFSWYFVSNCFWAIVAICFGRGIDKLDELVWLAASEPDRQEIVRRRRGKR